MAIIETLEGLSPFIPVPLVSELMKISIRVLRACDNASAIEMDVGELHRRVYSLTLVIVNTVPHQSKLSDELQARIEMLQTTLKKIIEDLNDIRHQNRLLLVLFPDPNKKIVCKCVDSLAGALEQFNVTSQLRAEELLESIKKKFSSVDDQLSTANVQLSDVRARLERIEAAVNPHTAPSDGKDDIRPAPLLFYGRDNDVDTITSLLASPLTSRVCITGPGGMGKTDLALTVVHSRPVQDIFPKYRFWVPCVKATSADLLRRILYIQLSITAESYDSLDGLIEELTASQERRLLLLDNFETPWDTAEQAQVQDIISRLAALPHISLLVTMTSKLPPTKEVQWQHYKLDSLDAAAAREVFNRLYPEAADAPKVKELLDAVDRIPLAITLMAADAQESQTSPEHLLQEWRSMGGPMIADMDQTIGRSVNRRVIKSNPEALPLLAILSMLPAGTTGDNLRWWAASVTSPSSTVSTLHKAALIEQERGSFESSRIFVRPTIQSYMARHADVTPDVKRQVHEASYAFVLARNSVPDDAQFKADLAALGNEETNIEGLLMQIDANNLYPNALDALIAFSLYRSRTKLSTVVALHALEVTRIVLNGSDAANRDSATRHVADAHYSLGKILFKLEHYKDACQHFDQARWYFKSLSTGPDCLSAGKCSMDLAFTWMYMIAGFNVADLGPLVLNAKADLSRDPSDKLHIAHGIFGHSFYLWWMTQTNEAIVLTHEAIEMIHEAIEMIRLAKEIFEELECAASTAACLWLMARSHARLGEYPTALALAKQGLAIANDAGDDDLLSRLLLITARYLTVLSRHDEVFSLLEQALAQNQALGRSLAIAQNLELFGYNYTAKLDLIAAEVSYRAALAHYSFKIGAADMGRDGAETGRERCSDNLQKLDAMKEDKEVFSKLVKPILF
ncbi:hypothetical protein B0H19DRAFT_1038559 [Mycena capillaripes]|nr:hypothetical protein B0H19DRAFT_1038559 [Mycena capillaripes]